MDQVLHKLRSEIDWSANQYTTWKGVLARAQDGDIAREASQEGIGPGLPGAAAGTQSKDHQDCTIFALANATGQPYGLVAASAANLIRQNEWREAVVRADPQKVMESTGLNGGEVIMLAEAFGRADVVPSADFAKTLQKGHVILINLYPGHEVVLTKTFLHGGETWYEIADSLQGPLRSLYLSAKELDAMRQENGVTYSPEPHKTPNILR